MYSKEEYDHLFYRMRKSIPTNSKLYLVVSIIKLCPLFFFSHTGGYTIPNDDLSTIHKYYKYMSLTFYLNYSFGPKGILIVILIILLFNLFLFSNLIYYFTQAKKVKQIDEKYENASSLNFEFDIFSNFSFFKYIIFFQFFQEINFLPLMCVPNIIDYEKIKINNIIINSNFEKDIDFLCVNSKFNFLIAISTINFCFDIFFYSILTSRFFDFNILSDYKWNFYPNFVFSFEFLECCTQIGFIFFLLYENKKFKIIIGIYTGIILLVDIYKYFKKQKFYSANSDTIIYVTQFLKFMCYISMAITLFFQLVFDKVPNDINIIGMLIFESIFVYFILRFIHRNDQCYIKNILVSSFKHLNESNIYGTLIFLLKEFKIFSDVSYKFSDENLDLFLEMYVNHLKICKDVYCPCRNYIKKVSGVTNTFKSGYTTMINLTHVKKGEEEYILNKFFNVLAANISPILKYSNNINVNLTNDNHRQNLIYQLRVKLIMAVKKLLSYKLEKLTKSLDNTLSNQFSRETKDFIRINFYAVNIFCNKSYYKTQFLYHEYLANFFRNGTRKYRFNLIYYFYLKMFSIHEYSKVSNKTGKQKSSGTSYFDSRNILSICLKYSEIEEKVVQTIVDFQKFMIYFVNAKIKFTQFLRLLKTLKKDYENITRYINYYFKNDKINNLFVCTKIILLFKVLHFDIPETLHNKLIIRIHENEVNKNITEMDTHYYLIVNYIQGIFAVKFISHELLLVLEYCEEDIKDKDFQILLPEKMRKSHKDILKNEIKTKGISINQKEIFLMGKNRTCILFDVQFKSLLNLKGEITILSIIKLKKASKEYRLCFACIDDEGELLAVNKEFEEFLILSLKVLDYVKIDVEKLLLQGMGGRMRKFFSDKENTVFQEQFDYDHYILSLFDEEFDNFKEENAKEYQRKYSRWEMLKEMSRKRRIYTKFMELTSNHRIIGNEKYYFMKFSLKLNETLKSIEPHHSSFSLLNAVKLSKKEMAKLSFFKGEEIYEHKDSLTQEDEEKVNEPQDDLFESQSQISSAICELKEKNSVRLFRQKQNKYLIFQKSSNISNLMFCIGFFFLVSGIYDIISLIIKQKIYQDTNDVFVLEMNAFFLKKDTISIASAITELTLLEEQIINKYDTSYLPTTINDNLKEVIELESKIINYVSYNVSFLSTLFLEEKIDSLINKEDSLVYIFHNGYIYQKDNSSLFQSIINIKKLGLDILNKYEDDYNFIGYYTDSTIYKYFFSNKISKLQDLVGNEDIEISDQESGIYFLMQNLFQKFEIYLNDLIFTTENLLQQYKSNTLRSVVTIKFAELIIIVIIIFVEWIFLLFGYRKAKKKMIKLFHKLDKRNIELTIKKIKEFIDFSNSFNITSLYSVADLDLKKIEEINPLTQTLDLAKGSLNNTLNSTQSPQSLRKGTSSFYQQGTNYSNRSYSNNNASLSKRREIKDTILKSFQELANENEKNNLNESTEGRKNLLKVMQKLDQIRGRKAKKTHKPSYSFKETSKFLHCEELDSEKIEEPRSENNSQSSNFESALNDPEKVIGEFSKNNNKKEINLTSIPDNSIKLDPPPKKRLSYTLNISQENEDNTPSKIIKFQDDALDSKTDLECVDRQKKQQRTIKVKFKEKNVRYYTPGQNINKNEESPFPSKNKIEKNDKNSKNDDNDKSKNDTQRPLLQENNFFQKYSKTYDINNSNDDLLMYSQRNDKKESSFKTISSNTFSPFNSITSSQGFGIKNEIRNAKKTTSWKDLNFDFSSGPFKGLNKIQLVEQGRALLVKKQPEQRKNEILKKEELIDKIENVIHNNLLAKCILHSSLGIFFILYSISIIINFVYNNSIKEASIYSHLLLNQTTLLNMIMLKYQYSVIEKEYDDVISKYVNQSKINTQLIREIESFGNPKVLPTVYELERDKSCHKIGTQMASVFNKEYNEEYEECTLVGDLINAKGLARAEETILSTLIILIEDWKKIISEGFEEEDKMIIEKLNDESFFNIICEIEYSIWKYSTLLMHYITKDVESIFSNILLYEKIFGYVGIFLNIILLILSLIFIIYPIKSVETIISWMIHKII